MCFTFLYTSSDAYITVISARILKIVPQNGTLYLSTSGFFYERNHHKKHILRTGHK